MKLIFVADYFQRDNGEYANGGAESDNETFIRWLESQGHEPKLIRSRNLNVNDIRQMDDTKYIIANFFDIIPDVKEKLIEYGDYIIWEHDHKYCVGRDPSPFENFVVPEHLVVNKEFYAKAKKVFGFSNLHAQVIGLNTGVPVQPLGTCFWNDHQFDWIKINASRLARVQAYAILQSGSPLKNTQGNIKYAIENQIKYSVINPMNYNDFIATLSQFYGLIFIPTSIETFSRIGAEALMMGLDLITDKSLLGLASEDWFGEVSGFQLIDLLKDKRDKAMKNILTAAMSEPITI